MSRLFHVWLLVASCVLTVVAPQNADAQGLIWNLPEDGAIVEYAGKYTNRQERPGNSNGPLELQWERRMTIQSVGQEMAEFDGMLTACRWIEIKLITGKSPTQGVEAESGIDPGPHGTTIYKFLVPENKVRGQLKDEHGLPVTFLPIVKGVRKVGQQPVQPLQSRALAFYPVLTLFANYIELESMGPQDVEVPEMGTIKTELMKGTLKLQNQTSKSENVGEIWLSPEVPFGWVKYRVKLTRMEKDVTAPDTAFAPAAEIDVEMSLVKAEATGARSELGDTSDVAVPADAADTTAADTTPEVTPDSTLETPAEMVPEEDQ